MEHYYYLLAVACCFMPFFIGGTWFYLNDTERVPPVIPKTISSPACPVGTGIMIKAYSCDTFFDRGDPLLINLKQVNLYNPELRPKNRMDFWYKDHTAKLMHNGACLAYIARYGYLEDTFWKNVEELNIHPEKDELFQKLIFSIQPTSWDVFVENSPNMLFHFSKKWEALPSIVDIINNDSRFAVVKRTYDFARECGEKEEAKSKT